MTVKLNESIIWLTYSVNRVFKLILLHKNLWLFFISEVYWFLSSTDNIYETYSFRDSAWHIFR